MMGAARITTIDDTITWCIVAADSELILELCEQYSGRAEDVSDILEKSDLDDLRTACDALGIGFIVVESDMVPESDSSISVKEFREDFGL